MTIPEVPATRREPRPSHPTVDRCVCQRAPFAALHRLATERGWSLDELVGHTGCGDQCGMCLPYLRRMVADGTTVFHELLPLDEGAS